METRRGEARKACNVGGLLCVSVERDGGGAGLIYSPAMRMLDGIIMPSNLLLPLLYRGPHASQICGPTLKISNGQ